MARAALRAIPFIRAASHSSNHLFNCNNLRRSFGELPESLFIDLQAGRHYYIKSV